jgi:hypothetical protein
LWEARKIGATTGRGSSTMIWSAEGVLAVTTAGCIEVRSAFQLKVTFPVFKPLSISAAGRANTALFV